MSVCAALAQAQAGGQAAAPPPAQHTGPPPMGPTGGSRPSGAGAGTAPHRGGAATAAERGGQAPNQHPAPAPAPAQQGPGGPVLLLHEVVNDPENIAPPGEREAVWRRACAAMREARAAMGALLEVEREHLVRSSVSIGLVVMGEPGPPGGWLDVQNMLFRLALGQGEAAERLHEVLAARMQLLRQRASARQRRQLPAAPEPALRAEAALLEEGERLFAEWQSAPEAAAGGHGSAVRPTFWPTNPASCPWRMLLISCLYLVRTKSEACLAGVLVLCLRHASTPLCKEGRVHWWLSPYAFMSAPERQPVVQCSTCLTKWLGWTGQLRAILSGLGEMASACRQAAPASVPVTGPPRSITAECKFHGTGGPRRPVWASAGRGAPGTAGPPERPGRRSTSGGRYICARWTQRSRCKL